MGGFYGRDAWAGLNRRRFSSSHSVQRCIVILSNARSHALVLTRVEPLRLHVPRKPEHPEHGNSVPVKVDFIPGQAVTGRLGMGVMIIVPALTERQQRYPEAVFRGVGRMKPLPSPHMSGGVHQPGRVQSHNRTEEDAPQ